MFLHRRRQVVTLTLLTVLGVLTAGIVQAPGAAAQPSAPAAIRAAAEILGDPATEAGTFRAVSAARILDTRSGLGAPAAPLTAHHALTLQILGRGGIPTTGVAAVALTLTATQPTGTGYLTAYPGPTRPTTANLSFTTATSSANLVIVPVAPDGKIRLYNGSTTATTHLIADITGYYLATDATPPGPVTAVTLGAPTKTNLTLTWSNPTATDYSGVMIRRSLGSIAPTSPTSGSLVADVPRTATRYVQTGLTPGTRYSYAFFAHDDVPNYGARATGSATTTAAGGPLSWGREISIDPNRGALRSVSCPSPTFCMAVDAWGATLRYNGSSWSAVTPAYPNADGFTGVSCTSSTFCMAVDFYGNAIPYTGSGWGPPVSVDTSGGGYNAISCTSPTFCVAVETYGYASVLHGTSWSTTSIAGFNSDLAAISCATTTFCLASDGQNGTYRYTGLGWTTDTDTAFGAVSCPSTTFCMATAQGGLARFDGTSWSAGVNADPGQSVAAVSCASSSSCTAVDSAGNALRYNGTDWTVPAPIPGGITGFVSISCPTAGFCAAVNFSADAAEFAGAGWTASPAVDPDRGNLQAVSCSSSSFCVAVGSSGDVLRYNGTWSDPVAVDPGLGGLAAVSCTSSTFCMAVGARSDAARFDGTSWHLTGALDTSILGLQGVSCASPTFCVAVGDGDAIVYTGSSWSAPIVLDTTAGSGFSSVSCPSTTFCALAEGSGRVVTYHGAGRWSAPVNLGQGMSRVSCTSATFCVASGKNGNQAATFDGTSWSAPVTIDPTAQGINSVSCGSAVFCIAGDTPNTLNGGNVLRYDGSGWAAPVRVDDSIVGIVGVSCPSVGFCMAVTNRGDAIAGLDLPTATAAATRLQSATGRPGTVPPRRLARLTGPRPADAPDPTR